MTICRPYLSIRGFHEWISPSGEVRFLVGNPIFSPRGFRWFIEVREQRMTGRGAKDFHLGLGNMATYFRKHGLPEIASELDMLASRFPD